MVLALAKEPKASKKLRNRNLKMSSTWAEIGKILETNAKSMNLWLKCKVTKTIQGQIPCQKRMN